MKQLEQPLDGLTCFKSSLDLESTAHNCRNQDFQYGQYDHTKTCTIHDRYPLETRDPSMLNDIFRWSPSMYINAVIDEA